MTPTTTEAQPQDYEVSPRGAAARWRVELDAAKKALQKWHEAAADVLRQYRVERKDGEDGSKPGWALFTANVETQMASLYGQTPRVSVSRRFADASDDTARVASEMLERLLNSDIEREDDTFAEALQGALEDRLLPGLGVVRVRYVAEFEEGKETPAHVDEETGEELAPAVPAVSRKAYECVEVDHVHWKDFLWSPARNWGEVRWVAFRAELARAESVKRFGKDVGQRLPFNAQRLGRTDEDDKKQQDPWGRTEVWEVWDKDTRSVYWLCEAWPEVLRPHGLETNADGGLPDPLGLKRFFPCPKPLLSMATTSTMVPRPEYVVAKALYEEVDTLTQRISLLSDAVKVAGAYDKGAGSALAGILTGTGNKLVPVDNWAAFSEKGGIRGVIDWLPLEQVVAAINVLSERRMVAKDALYEVTGMADVMRGASDPRETARAQGIKAKFGSVRLQRKQDEVARFASDVQRLKAEIVAAHFEPATIVEASNILQTPDAPMAQKAVELIKSGRAQHRVEVKPEAVALQDFAQLKGEALELLEGLAGYFQAVAPVVTAAPAAAPLMLEMLQLSLARVRGAQAMEGVLDRAIEAARQALAQPQQGAQGPSPEQVKLQAVQMKAQADLAREDRKAQNQMALIQAEQQADAMREAVQREENVKEAAQKHAITALGRAQQPGPRGPAGGGL